MYLNLIDLRRPDLGIFLHLIDMADSEIADADAPDLTLLY